MWLPDRHDTWIDTLGAICLALFLFGILGVLLVVAPAVAIYQVFFS